MNHTMMRFAMAVMLLMPVLAFAQSEPLPRAGLTPESRFYFLDTLGEALRELLTFSAEGKARLQVTFAGERISEIRVVLEARGVDAPGLSVAEERLKAHLAEAAAIVEKKKAAGNDVSALAQELDGDIEDEKDALREAFKARERALKEEAQALAREIEAARAAGNAAQVEALRAELAAVKAEREKLGDEREDREEALEAAKEKMEREMDDKAEAEEAIREAEEEKAEALAEAAKESTTLPAGFFEKFDRLLAQAKELFDRGNYQGAEQLAEQAEDALDEEEDALEESDDEGEDNDDKSGSRSGKGDGDREDDEKDELE